MPFGQKRSGGRGRGDKKTGDKQQGQRRPMFRRRKVCKFCADKIDDINYKDVKLLGAFVPERGKILPRRISGTCAMHQRKLQTAIKRARQIVERGRDTPPVADRPPQLKALRQQRLGLGVVAAFHNNRAQVAERVGNPAIIAKRAEQRQVALGERARLRVVALDKAKHTRAG